MEGEVVNEKKYPDLKEKEVAEAIYSLTDISELPVSLYSALKKDGKPLYKYAREGQEIEVPIKPMTVLQSSMLDFYNKEPFQVTRVRFHVSKGTYIRSLAEELGKRLNTPATLFSLRRTKVGEYALEDACTIPEEWLTAFKNKKQDQKS